MKNFIGENKQPTIVLLADCDAGDFVCNGAKHGFAITSGVAGETIAIKTEGLFTAPKAAEGQAVGDLLCYHATNKNWQKAETADGMYRAYVNVAADSGDATVELALIQARLVGEQGDITDVTAGAGLTGGGSSGAVTVAVDFGTDAETVCEGNDSRLSDAREPTEHTHAADEVEYTNDALSNVTEADGALDAIVDVLRVLPKVKQVVVALGATTGTSAADSTLAGGRVTGIVPVSGNDQPVAGYAIDAGTGVITLTLADASTAEATFDVWVQPVLPA